MTTIRWGILGTGNISRQFAAGLSVLSDAELVAVGSRRQQTADAFGDSFNVPHRHATYEALANDPDVDAVYVGTPHHLHYENTLMCLEAGKAVLCEKPFAINAIQTQEMIEAARSRDLFLMEAMWTRFMPVMTHIRELLADGTLGEVRMISADFGFRTELNPESRLFRPEMGGGGLLDVGVYPVSLASMVFGAPARIATMAHLGETGVDEQAAIILSYEQGQLATLMSAIRTDTHNEAILIGTEGRIHIHPQWWYPEKFTLYRKNGNNETVHRAYEGNGYNYEAVEVMDCLRAGKLESDIMPLDETLSIMRTLDAIRAEWGLKYPIE